MLSVDPFNDPNTLYLNSRLLMVLSWGLRLLFSGQWPKRSTYLSDSRCSVFVTLQSF